MNENSAAESDEKKAECIFCTIANGSTDAEVVYETDETIFFHDISPKASVHVVGIPKTHIKSLTEAAEQNFELVGRLIKDITIVADQLGLTEGGYRVITNVGSNAGQEVQHLHWHILGGETLGPLRC